MKRMIHLTAVLLIGTIGMPGCDDCKCPGPNSVSKYINIEGVGSYVSKKSSASATSGPSAVKASDKVRWEELTYFSIGYTTRTYGARINQQKPRSSWGATAYACDCTYIPGYLGSQEKLKRITVRTVFDFDVNYPAGSTVDELVRVSTYPGDKPLSEYLSKSPLPYNEYSRLDLSINKVPSAKGPFALDITVELDNGEVYTTRTPVIELI